MSLNVRLKFRTKKGSAPKTTQFEVQHGQLDAAQWAECLEKFKALFKQYNLPLKLKRPDK